MNNYGLLSLGHCNVFFRNKAGGEFCSDRQEVLPILSLLSEKLPPNTVSPSWKKALDTFFGEGIEWNWPNFYRYFRMFFRSGQCSEQEFGPLVETEMWKMLLSYPRQKQEEPIYFFSEIDFDEKVNSLY